MSGKFFVTSKMEQNPSGCAIGIWNYHLAPSESKSRIFPGPYPSPLWMCWTWTVDHGLERQKKGGQNQAKHRWMKHGWVENGKGRTRRAHIHVWAYVWAEHWKGGTCTRRTRTDGSRKGRTTVRRPVAKVDHLLNALQNYSFAVD